MLLSMATMAAELGLRARVVAPSEPGEVIERAKAIGLDHLSVDARDRRSYFSNLARRRELHGDLWWCNGLVPALATAGSRHRRVVHLHQEPTGAQRSAARLARAGAERTYVPSESMAARVPGAHVLANWTRELPRTSPVPAAGGSIRIGFIGRFSTIKGLHVLARALQRLERLDTPNVQLVLAGDERFVPPDQQEAVVQEVGKLADVVRLGWVEPQTFYEQVDVVVVPSVWAEPFGLVAAEAMAVGRPLVVSDAGALPEVVGPDHPWVARAGDAVDTSEVIRAVLRADEAERAAVCDRARARWAANFGPVAATRRFGAVLGELGFLGDDGAVPETSTG